jgi:hypothetical protein
MPIVPLYGEQGGETVLALGIPGACAETVQDEELSYRPDCELPLRSQIHLDGLSLW